MPAAALPAIIGLGGAVAQGIGGSGKQGGTKGTFRQTGSSSETGSADSTRSGTSTSQQTELESLGPFRDALMSVFSGALSDAQRPAFGQAEIASVLNNINDASGAASKSLASRLARTGSLDSGRLASGQAAIEGGRASDISGFLSQVPSLNRTAREASLNPLLSLGLGFTGRGPTGVTTTANDVSSNVFSSDRTFDQTGNSQNDQYGQPWWKALLSGGGGLAQQAAFPYIADSLFGGGRGGGGSYQLT